MCGYELANKSAKFHAKRLKRSENIPKRFRGWLLFLKHPVDDALDATSLIMANQQFCDLVFTGLRLRVLLICTICR